MKPFLPLAATFFLVCGLNAADWPQWRGPNFNGSTSETGLPSDWSKTRNVAWKAALPGTSAATPIVSRGHVFVSTTDRGEDSLRAMCFDKASGKLLWSHQVAKGMRRESQSNFASPSPAADGQRVIFFYGNGEMVAYNYNGGKLWSRNIQKDYGGFAFLWTPSTSPVLYGGRLFLQVLQRDVAVQDRGFTDRENESYILALDPKTGRELWRQVRPSQARAESREAFTTPIPFEFRGRKELLVVGGDVLTGHDPATGRELWRWGTWNPTRIGHWRLVPSPVAGDGIILMCAPKRSPIYAIKAGGSGKLGDQAVAWVSTEQRVVSADVPTPAFYDGDFFVLSDVRKAISRIDPKTGAIKWSTELVGFRKFEASPLAADGRIYFMDFRGTVVIVSAADGKMLRTIPMGKEQDSRMRSSIAAAGGQLFIRTNSELFCIGKPKDVAVKAKPEVFVQFDGPGS